MIEENIKRSAKMYEKQHTHTLTGKQTHHIMISELEHSQRNSTILKWYLQ